MVFCGMKLNKQKQKRFYFCFFILGEKNGRNRSCHNCICLALAFNLIAGSVAGRGSMKYTPHKCDEAFPLRALACLFLIVSIALVCKWLMHEHVVVDVVVEHTLESIRLQAPGVAKDNKRNANYSLIFAKWKCLSRNNLIISCRLRQKCSDGAECRIQISSKSSSIIEMGCEQMSNCFSRRLKFCFLFFDCWSSRVNRINAATIRENVEIKSGNSNLIKNERALMAMTSEITAECDWQKTTKQG